MGDVVSDSGSDAKVVDLGAGVPEKLPGEPTGEEASKYDPHWWHDPRNAEVAVGEIERQLAEADPDGAADFKANAESYLAQIKALDANIAKCMHTVPAEERRLVTDHDAFGYFAKRYGIDVVGAVFPTQTAEGQPSAKDLSELADKVEAENVKTVFPQASVSSKVAEALARETGASSDHTLYGDTLGPADSNGATYLEMEAANANAMVSGFTGGKDKCKVSP
jgi:ABC-type Zn uptake system ZnuABC Zn-binding protein ZnuA